jgi:hypothetical protein
MSTEPECGVIGYKCPVCGHVDPEYIDSKEPIELNLEYGQSVRINGVLFKLTSGGVYIRQ